MKKKRFMTTAPGQRLLGHDDEVDDGQEGGRQGKAVVAEIS